MYECLAFLEKCRDDKDIDILWDIVFVICVIYGIMRDMVVKDSKNIRYNCCRSCRDCFPRGKIL